ncbi:unnamed protein product [Closterium sp. NIES-65]|nr:unnamed protein product [Closterium sp. NIES-65]
MPNPFQRYLTELPNPDGGSFGSYYSLPALKDSRIEPVLSLTPRSFLSSPFLFLPSFPQLPVDLVINHPVQADYAEASNQVNQEYLARVVMEVNGLLYPDSVISTDSCSTLIHGLGIVGWDERGSKAKSAVRGEPIRMDLPQVVGVNITGRLRAGATATDLAMACMKNLPSMLNTCVEFYGEGTRELSVEDRSTVANMLSGFGAAMGFFPVDSVTLQHLRDTGRDEAKVKQVEAYMRANHLFLDHATTGEAEAKPKYSSYLQLDLAAVEPCVCGPLISGPGVSRRYCLVIAAIASAQPVQPLLSCLNLSASDSLNCFVSTTRSPLLVSLPQGFGILPDQQGKSVPVTLEEGVQIQLKHGSVVIAAITSCTGALNPAEMLTAALVAKKASERGLQVKPWVKTGLAPASNVVTKYLEARGLQVKAYEKVSLAPVSNVVTKYLEASGLLPALEGQGFHVVGYDCTTCIGSLAEISESVKEAISDNGLVAATVQSCNGTSEGHVHPLFRANYLASPPLVVAYALAGTVNKNFEEESIGSDKDGKEVFLRDIWPSNEELAEVVERAMLPQLFQSVYETVREGASDALWNSLPAHNEIGWRDRTDAASLLSIHGGDGSRMRGCCPPFPMPPPCVRPLHAPLSSHQVYTEDMEADALRLLPPVPPLPFGTVHHAYSPPCPLARTSVDEHLNAQLQAYAILAEKHEDWAVFSADDFEEVWINFDEIQAAFAKLQQQVEAQRGAVAEERDAANKRVRQMERNRERTRLASGGDCGQEGCGERSPARRVLISDFEQAGLASQPAATADTMLPMVLELVRISAEDRRHELGTYNKAEGGRVSEVGHILMSLELPIAHVFITPEQFLAAANMLKKDEEKSWAEVGGEMRGGDVSVMGVLGLMLSFPRCLPHVPPFLSSVSAQIALNSPRDDLQLPPCLTSQRWMVCGDDGWCVRIVGLNQREGWYEAMGKQGSMRNEEHIVWFFTAYHHLTQWGGGFVAGEIDEHEARGSQPPMLPHALTHLVLPSAHLVLPSAHLVLPSAHLVLPSAHLVLPSAHLVLPSAHLVLPSAHLVLPSAHLVLPSAHLVLPSAHLVLAWSPHAPPITHSMHRQSPTACTANFPQHAPPITHSMHRQSPTACTANHPQHAPPITHSIHCQSPTACTANHPQHAPPITHSMHRQSPTACTANHPQHAPPITHSMHDQSPTACTANHPQHAPPIT